MTGCLGHGSSARLADQLIDHLLETHLIPLVLQVALGKRDKVTVFGADHPTRDGSRVRDYIHSVDLAQTHILALEALDCRSRTYNLGNSQGFSVKGVIKMGRAITSHAIPTESGPRRAGDVAILVAGSDKIRDEPSWKPKPTYTPSCKERGSGTRNFQTAMEHRTATNGSQFTHSSIA